MAEAETGAVTEAGPADYGDHFPGSGIMAGADNLADVMSGCDVITPALFALKPGTALEFSPPQGRSATDVLRHLKKKGVRLGWPTPLLAVAENTWAVKVPDAEANKAEALLRRMA